MKTVVITGASRGIGLATAGKFAQEGWRVVGTSTKGNIPLEGGNLIPIQLDIADSNSRDKVAQEIKNKVGKVDVLINNAGVLLDRESSHIDADVLKKTLEVNVIGLADFAEKIIPFMGNGGHIISIGSLMGVLSPDGLSGESTPIGPAYRMSKAAVSMFTRSMAGRLEGEGITVSILDPGWVKTDMGGEGAIREPSEVGAELFDLATREGIPTGRFWFQGKERSW